MSAAAAARGDRARDAAPTRRAGADNLRWVHDEVRARINDSRLAVEAHAGAPQEWQHLERCAVLVHQIHRVLALVGLHGAAMLVEEIGALVRELHARRVACGADTHEALMRSLVDLAGHLDRLRGGWREHPLDLLQMVNDLRGARGVALASAGALFSPALWSALPADAARPLRRPADLPGVVRRLRSFYQAALLAVLRATESGAGEALLRMDAILERVEMLAAGHEALRVWWIARALVQDLGAGEIELTVAVKRLLGQLDSELRDLARDGDAALAARPGAELLRHLLYYVAHSPVRSGRSAAVKQAFALAPLVAPQEGPAGGGRYAAALSAVAGPLNEQLGELEDLLNGRAGAIDTTALALRVRQLAVTFGLLGADELRAALRAWAEQALAGGVPGGDNDHFVALAEDLLRARTVVASLTRPGADGVPDAAAVVEIRYREALAQAVAQLRSELFLVKEGLNAYAAGEADSSELSPVVGAMARSVGVLRLLAHAGAAALAPWLWVLRGAGQGPQARIERGALEQLAGAILEAEAALEDIVAAPLAGARRSSAREGRQEALPREGRQEALPREGRQEALPREGRQEASAPEGRQATSGRPARHETQPPHGGRPSAPAPAPAGHESEAMDDELREVFAEEMSEVIGTLRDLVPRWADDPSSREALLEIRRAFHTLKGSGRVVGAVEIGDFAWSVERLLNRLVDGTLGSSPALGALVRAATDVLPEVLAALRAGGPLPCGVTALRDRAHGLAA